jgi:hypothetical protein
MIEKVTVNCILLISLKFYKSNSFKLFRWAPMTPSSHWLPPIKGNETIILSTKDMDVPMPKKKTWMSHASIDASERKKG